MTVIEATPIPPTSSQQPLSANHDCCMTSLMIGQGLRHQSKLSHDRSSHLMAPPQTFPAATPSSSPRSSAFLVDVSKLGTAASDARPTGDLVDPDFNLVHPVLRVKSPPSLMEPEDAEAKAWMLTENNQDGTKEIANVNPFPSDEGAAVITQQPRSGVNITGVNTTGANTTSNAGNENEATIIVIATSSSWPTDPPRPNMTGHILLACCVILCNPMCGLLAFFFAVYAMCLSSAGEFRKAVAFGSLSIYLSITGICIALLYTTLILVGVLRPSYVYYY